MTDISGLGPKARQKGGFDDIYRVAAMARTLGIPARVARAPWDIGQPQAAFRALRDDGRLVGRVLDVGCGTGEHALMASAVGLDATGVDSSPTAIAIAQRKASQRRLPARFLIGDALQLADIGESFDTILDCGLFHVFDDQDREAFVNALRASMTQGGHYYMLCFSDLAPRGWGPRRISQDEIRASFDDGWQVEGIEPTRLELTIPPGSVCAWLASVVRT